MFTLQNRLRIYIVLSIGVYTILTLSVFVIDTYLNFIFQQFPQINPSITQFLNKIYIFTLIVSLVAIALGVYVLVSIYIRGINKYKEIDRRFFGTDLVGDFNLKSIEFPSEDEFGHMGKHLNNILDRVERFDHLKSQRIMTERMKFELLGEIIDVPLLTIQIEEHDKVIKYYNELFKDKFAKKIVKDEEEDLFFDFKNAMLSALRIQENVFGLKPLPVDESENMDLNMFIDSEFVQAIDLTLSTLTSTTIRKEIWNIYGDVLYYSDEIKIYPIWDDYGKVQEVVILFDKLKIKQTKAKEKKTNE